ncbi:MAG: hypothetical protein WC565_08220 [Parcubacteria group bacterium]
MCNDMSEAYRLRCKANAVAFLRQAADELDRCESAEHMDARIEMDVREVWPDEQDHRQYAVFGINSIHFTLYAAHYAAKDVEWPAWPGGKTHV